MMFPARDQSAEVVKPGEEAFDFPASAVAPQFTTVLGGAAAIVFMGGAMSRIRRLCRRRWSSESLS